MKVVHNETKASPLAVNTIGIHELLFIGSLMHVAYLDFARKDTMDTNLL
jgi:hypothetical protein